MASYNEIIEIENAIDRELPLVMQDEVKELVLNLMESATEMVYVNKPKFESRRRYGGGIADRKTWTDNYSPAEKELTISIDTDWQQLLKGEKPDAKLADVLENNRVYSAPPKKFMKQAEQIVKARREQLEGIIADYLNRTV